MPITEEIVEVTGYEEAAQVLRGEGWSSAGGEASAFLPPNVLLFMDPPDHTRLRRLISPAFTPRSIERLRPRVEAVAGAVLDGLFEESGEADLLADLGYVMPLAVIAELLDVGIEGAEIFGEETPALVRMLEVDPSPEDIEQSMAAANELMMFLVPILTERREHPGDDFISFLLRAEELTIDEVLSTCMLLLAAGHETTANIIGNGALALLRDPAQIPHLHADPARAVEELLRMESPVRFAGRVATMDHDLGGQKIAAGTPVLVRIDAANRDPRRFPDPERLDLSREPVPNLAFGAGHHYCLGAALARLEANVTLPRLFQRFPELSLVNDEPRWRESTTFHGLTELPVRAARGIMVS
ncbi:cytochrome P450 [Actinomadura barringtoniae]|uniref:Cytochrome P450 n=1 Tax=Actinomadura barringtoniae TaxID=1427535 RepID=A0A939PJ67_9ACTN|nr:cytochrome P450 [Actinomadura barringtoniae]MBO2453716.1 cytochrome P450 [Actinomadura barringtoniae]